MEIWRRRCSQCCRCAPGSALEDGETRSVFGPRGQSCRRFRRTGAGHARSERAERPVVAVVGLLSISNKALARKTVRFSLLSGACGRPALLPRPQSLGHRLGMSGLCHGRVSPASQATLLAIAVVGLVRQAGPCLTTAGGRGWHGVESAVLSACAHPIVNVYSPASSSTVAGLTPVSCLYVFVRAEASRLVHDTRASAPARPPFPHASSNTHPRKG